MAIKRKSSVALNKKLSGKINTPADCSCWGNDAYTCSLWKKTCASCGLAPDMRKFLGRIQSPLSKKR